MKCVDTTSDRKADAVVRAGDQLCDEYGTHLASDGAICTWIPVSDGQKVIVETGFVGTTKEIQFDLVVDGVLRNSEKTTRKTEKKERKPERFDRGFYAQSKTSIVQAEMEIKALDVSAYPSVQVDGKDSVGTIEVRISVLRDEHEERHKLDDVRSFETIMDWKEAHRTPSYSKVRPVQQVDLVPSDQQPTKTQMTKLRLRSSGHRPGSKPWVVFRFYYRTNDAITNEVLSKTKTDGKLALNFEAPPIEKTAVGSSVAPSILAPSTLAETTATTAKEPFAKAGTTTTTAEASSTKVPAAAKAEASSTNAATSTVEGPGNDETAVSEIPYAETPKLPVADRKEGVTQSAVSANLAITDLRSEQPDLATKARTTILLVGTSNSSNINTVEEHSVPLAIEEPFTMTIFASPPLAAEVQPALPAKVVEVATQPLEVEILEAPVVSLTEVASQPLMTERQPAPIANMAAVNTIDMTSEKAAPIDRPKTPKPLTNSVPIPQMLPGMEVVSESPTPPATPKPVIEETTRPETSAIAATVFSASTDLELEPVAESASAAEAGKVQPPIPHTEALEPVMESIELKFEPAKTEPTILKSSQKPLIVKSSNGLKRAFSGTPTPDPATKRMKFENGELEKRIAERKKALEEKRTNRIKMQKKATEAQEKAAIVEVCSNQIPISLTLF